MNDIDWDKAPEGTTYASTCPEAIRNYGVWRKEEGGMIYRWELGQWVVHSYVPEVWKRVNDGLFVERPAPVQPPLPNGLTWDDAPEDATHYHEQDVAGDVHAWWLKKTEDGGYFWWKVSGDGLMEGWSHVSDDLWCVKQPEFLTIARNGVPPQEKPLAPKKPIGWWA